MQQELELLDTIVGQVILRRVEDHDISFHARYLFDSPRDFLEGIGFDTSKLPDRREWELNAKQRIIAARDKGDPPTVVVAEYQGRAVSMVFLDRRNPDNIPRLHFHIFEPELRARGLGRDIFAAGVRAFSRLHAIDRFLIEPKADNARMNCLMRKMGFKHIKDYLIAAGPVTQEFLASQYEIIAPQGDRRKAPLSKPDISIRRATKIDVEQIVRLANAGGPEGKPKQALPAVLPDGYIHAFHRIDADPNQALMVAEIGGRIVGTFHLTYLTYLAGAGREDCQIEAVHVDRDWRGRGIGTSMMQCAIASASNRQCRRLQLTTNKKRKDAHRFYERLGFELSHEAAKLVLPQRELE